MKCFIITASLLGILLGSITIYNSLNAKRSKMKIENRGKIIDVNIIRSNNLLYPLKRELIFKVEGKSTSGEVMKIVKVKGMTLEDTHDKVVYNGTANGVEIIVSGVVVETIEY